MWVANIIQKLNDFVGWTDQIHGAKDNSIEIWINFFFNDLGPNAIYINSKKFRVQTLCFMPLCPGPILFVGDQRIGSWGNCYGSDHSTEFVYYYDLCIYVIFLACIIGFAYMLLVWSLIMQGGSIRLLDWKILIFADRQFDFWCDILVT